MDEKILREAGLTDGEIKVYLTLLEIGSCTTGPIVERSGVARSIIYQILDRLIEKGLVSYIVKEKTKYYQSARPERLLDYIDERSKKLQANRTEVERLLPELMLKAHTAKQSEAHIFEGFKGAMTVHEDLLRRLKKGEEFYYMGIPADQPEHFYSYWQRAHQRRHKRGITCKLLFHKDTQHRIVQTPSPYPGAEARYMPVNIDTPAWFAGCKGIAVIGFPSKNPLTIEIVNDEIAASFQAYFDEFWRQSKPVSSRREGNSTFINKKALSTAIPQKNTSGISRKRPPVT